ncbi:hypothetical protein WDU94_002088 [Cyamophila willieti]
MSKQDGANNAKPGDGIKSLRTSSFFRALNFELYATPNNTVMLIGIGAITFFSLRTYSTCDKKEIQMGLMRPNNGTFYFLRLLSKVCDVLFVCSEYHTTSWDVIMCATSH